MTQMFSIFLSTNSNLGAFAPSQDCFPLERATNADDVQPPYTELPFDCHPDFPIQPEQLSLEDTSKLAFLCRFGRPL
jgi:hypothetical protein